MYAQSAQIQCLFLDPYAVIGSVPIGLLLKWESDTGDWLESNGCPGENISNYFKLKSQKNVINRTGLSIRLQIILWLDYSFVIIIAAYVHK